MKDIVIVGGGGHAASLADCIESMNEFRIVGYTDIQPSGMDYAYLGTDAELPAVFAGGVTCAACGIGFLGHGTVRDKIYSMLKAIGFVLPVIIDASAAVARNVRIGEGTLIAKGAAVNANARIGKMCIINSHALVEHDNKIEDYAHISVGVNLCGNVSVGSHSFVGAGATIIQGVTVGMNTIIGASTLVLHDVGDYVCKIQNREFYGGGGGVDSF